jgi:hypothetical protein
MGVAKAATTSISSGSESDSDSSEKRTVPSPTAAAQKKLQQVQTDATNALNNPEVQGFLAKAKTDAMNTFFGLMKRSTFEKMKNDSLAVVEKAKKDASAMVEGVKKDASNAFAPKEPLSRFEQMKETLSIWLKKPRMMPPRP